jgi:hypothetical protein
VVEWFKISRKAYFSLEGNFRFSSALLAGCHPLYHVEGPVLATRQSSLSNLDPARVLGDTDATRLHTDTAILRLVGERKELCPEFPFTGSEEDSETKS